MSDVNVLMFAWLRDRETKNTSRRSIINELMMYPDAYEKLNAMCFHGYNKLDRFWLEVARRLNADFREFRLKPRARKYLLRRFVNKYQITADEAYRRFCAKSESSKKTNMIDWGDFYANLLDLPAV